MSATLTVNGQDFVGWTDIEVAASIESIVREFRFSASENYPPVGEALQINAGDEVEVRLEDQLVISGHVDSVGVEYDAQSHTQTYSGRSKTGDLVDCSVTHSGQFRTQSVPQIIAELCSPYGVSVIAHPDSGGTIQNFQIEHGEAVFSAIDRLVQFRGLLALDDGEGNLFLSKLGTERSPVALIRGRNILACSAQASTVNRFSQITVKGQSTGDDENFGLAATGLAASATDSTIQRRRELIIESEADATLTDLQQQAEWEVAARHGEGFSITYTVQGWLAEKDLWSPGWRVTVVDDLVNLPTEELVIADVRFSLSNESGTTTQLTLKPITAFQSAADLSATVGLETQVRG